MVEDDVAGSSPNNVQGALYEFRLASAYVDDVDDVAAKSGSIRYDDIQAKMIRYEAHQLTGDLDAGGEMVVTPSKYEFVKRRNGEPTKVGRLIENTDGVRWETFDPTTSG